MNYLNDELKKAIDGIYDDKEFQRIATEYIIHKTRIEDLTTDLKMFEENDETNLLVLIKHYESCLNNEEKAAADKIMKISNNKIKDHIGSGIIHQIILRQWIKEEEEKLAEIEKEYSEYITKINLTIMTAAATTYLEESKKAIEGNKFVEQWASKTYSNEFIDKYFINKDDPIVHSIKPILDAFIEYIMSEESPRKLSEDVDLEPINKN